MLFSQAWRCTYLQHIPSLEAQLILSRSIEIKLGNGFHTVSWWQSKAGRKYKLVNIYELLRLLSLAPRKLIGNAVICMWTSMYQPLLDITY